MKIWLAVLTISLFSSCTSKKESQFIDSYKNRKLQNKILQKTEKIQLYNKDNATTHVLITASYQKIKQSKNQSKEDELFVIGIYDDNQTEHSDLTEFSLRLNNIPAKSIKPIKNIHKYKNIPFVISWGEYYLVRFPHIPQKSMKLSIKHKSFEKAEVHFAKVAKYILDKKKI